MSPISTKDLYAFLPHKPPMVWIDEVSDFKDGEGKATLTLKQHGLYMTRGTLRPSSFIEFIAQSYAFVNLAHLRSGGMTDTVHTKTYLAAVKDFKFEMDKLPRTGDTITVHVRRTRNFGPIAVVHGDCLSISGEKLASCELKLFSE